MLKNLVYISYRKNYNFIKLQRRDVYIDSLLTSDSNIKLLDFENDTRFHVMDYKNDDHLNSNGAKKLSLLINDYLKSIDTYNFQ